MSICALPALCRLLLREGIRLVGLEPTTPRLSSACSNQLSYSRVDVEGKDRAAYRRPTRFRGVSTWEHLFVYVFPYSIERR